MQAYVAATRERLNHAKAEKGVKTGRQAEKQALRREDEALREKRYQVRERRKQEDAAWRAFRKQFQLEQMAYRALPKAERQKQPQRDKAMQQRWQAAWERRRLGLAFREQENAKWRIQRQQLRERAGQVPDPEAWLAILVVTDNCTRQCLGLPLFVTGSKVTAETVVNALEALLPPELQYLISDQGSHFRTVAFANLAERRDFIWVPVARHRAQSNGIAERFVRTLKEWLEDKAWQSSEKLAALLAEFLPEYNDRPHQGLPIPGLSPNEFAQRIWLI